MNQLKEVIRNNYRQLPKTQVLQITMDVCYQQMKKISELTQEQNIDSDKDVILLNLKKVDWYSKINDGLLEFLNDQKDIQKIDIAKTSIKYLITLIENEILEDLEKGNPNVQEKIVNEIIIPHYLIEWSLENL